MADNTPIEWCDATWNPVTGCSRVHDGCVNCYAEIMAARFSKPGQWGEGLARIVTLPNGKADHRWTGKVRFNPRTLTQPLHWRKPRRIFVNSTGDTFHDGVTGDQLDQMFAVMALCPQHTFQVLTKRPERAQEYLSRPDVSVRVGLLAFGMTMDALAASPKSNVGAGIVLKATDINPGALKLWPLPNVWIGTSASDQASADAMIPHLLATPAAVRFVSVEPMLERVDLTCFRHYKIAENITIVQNPLTGVNGMCDATARLHWVICGGESGPGARPFNADWARDLRDQCRAAKVAFFMKQMGGPRKPFPPIPDDLMIREFPHG